MRLLSTLDWNDFFEKVSLIESLLGKDPAASIHGWSLPRAIVTATSLSESVSGPRTANSTSHKPRSIFAAQGKEEAEKHVGYYLIDTGLTSLETKFQYQPRTDRTSAPLSVATRDRLLSRHPHLHDGLVMISILMAMRR
jgi:hypothetical protein